MTPLRPSEQAVLSAYIAETNTSGRRRLTLSKHDLARMTGFPSGQCCNARRSLVERGLLRKVGFSQPMVVEVTL